MADENHKEAVMQRRATRSWLAVWWPALVLVFIAVLYGGFVGVVRWVQGNAREVAVRATEVFPGDEIEALVALVQSEDRSLADRNRAVWALGQLGDERALPMLKRFYTARACDHSKFLCQKELRKAIDRCNGENWAPEWLPLFPRRSQQRLGTS
jgi:hypothetical protein